MNASDGRARVLADLTVSAVKKRRVMAEDVGREVKDL
jgi:hypothetical protein